VRKRHSRAHTVMGASSQPSQPAADIDRASIVAASMVRRRKRDPRGRPGVPASGAMCSFRGGRTLGRGGAGWLGTYFILGFTPATVALPNVASAGDVEFVGAGTNSRLAAWIASRRVSPPASAAFSAHMRLAITIKRTALETRTTLHGFENLCTACNGFLDLLACSSDTRSRCGYGRVDRVPQSRWCDEPGPTWQRFRRARASLPAPISPPRRSRTLRARLCIPCNFGHNAGSYERGSQRARPVSSARG
jgi:hypothetical protein